MSALQAPVSTAPFIPQSGARITNAARSANAAQFRDLLIDLLNEHGPLKAAQLVDLTGSKLTTVREYMSKLVNDGRAASKRMPNPVTNGFTWFALYSVGDGLAPLKGETPKQKTLTTYPLHHVRHPQDIAFFGPARI